MKSDKEIVDLVRSIMYSADQNDMITCVYELSSLLAKRDGIQVDHNSNRLILMLEKLEEIDPLTFLALETIND